MLELIFSFLIPSDIIKRGDYSMFSKSEQFLSTDGVSQSDKIKFDKFIDD